MICAEKLNYIKLLNYRKEERWKCATLNQMLSIRGKQFILYKTQSPIELIAAENVVYKKKLVYALSMKKRLLLKMTKLLTR